MPELPDLTVFAESLRALVLNRPISDAAYLKKKRLDVPAEEFAALLAGRKLTAVERVGKELLFHLDDGNRFLVHLALSGGFFWGKKDEPPRSPVLTMAFQSGELLAVTDPQSLVTVNVNPDLSRRPPDALEVDAPLLEKICRSKPRVLIKALIIDQKVIGGIGNAYSDEILWEARVSPKSPAGKLPTEAVDRLAQSMRSVLEHAVRYLRENHPGIISGEVRDFLKVHVRNRKESPTGHPIIVEEIASKRTYYTEEQTLYD